MTDKQYKEMTEMIKDLSIQIYKLEQITLKIKGFETHSNFDDLLSRRNQTLNYHYPLKWEELTFEQKKEACENNLL